MPFESRSVAALLMAALACAGAPRAQAENAAAPRPA
jgi:hypothetical protein